MQGSMLGMASVRQRVDKCILGSVLVGIAGVKFVSIQLTVRQKSWFANVPDLRPRCTQPRLLVWGVLDDQLLDLR